MTEEQSLKTGVQELEEKADYNMRYYLHLMKLSKDKPAEFWGSLAEELLDWYEPWKETMKQEDPMTKWFIGGKINASYNAIDRHLNGP
ncbi:MAG: acetyl-coenzyme A synthetase N-terminal domain-containing protein, partial [Metallosphaera sp.]